MTTILRILIWGLAVCFSGGTAASESDPQRSTRPSVPPEEWQAFEKEMQTLRDGPVAPRIEDIQKIQDKWFAKWGLLQDIENDKVEVELLKRKYKFALPSDADPNDPEFVKKYSMVLDPTESFVHDRRMFDPNGWTCALTEKEDGVMTVAVALKASHYAGFRPVKVEAAVRSGSPDVPFPSTTPASYEVWIPVGLASAEDGTFRAELMLPEDMRQHLVLDIRAVMEPRWVAYGGFALAKSNERVEGKP